MSKLSLKKNIKKNRTLKKFGGANKVEAKKVGIITAKKIKREASMSRRGNNEINILEEKARQKLANQAAKIINEKEKEKRILRISNNKKQDLTVMAGKLLSTRSGIWSNKPSSSKALSSPPPAVTPPPPPSPSNTPAALSPPSNTSSAVSSPPNPPAAVSPQSQVKPKQKLPPLALSSPSNTPPALSPPLGTPFNGPLSKILSLPSKADVPRQSSPYIEYLNDMIKELNGPNEKIKGSIRTHLKSKVSPIIGELRPNNMLPNNSTIKLLLENIIKKEKENPNTRMVAERKKAESIAEAPKILADKVAARAAAKTSTEAEAKLKAAEEKALVDEAARAEEAERLRKEEEVKAAEAERLRKEEETRAEAERLRKEEEVKAADAAAKTLADEAERLRKEEERRKKTEEAERLRKEEEVKAAEEAAKVLADEAAKKKQEAAKALADETARVKADQEVSNEEKQNKELANDSARRQKILQNAQEAINISINALKPKSSTNKAQLAALQAQSAANEELNAALFQKQKQKQFVYKPIPIKKSRIIDFKKLANTQELEQLKSEQSEKTKELEQLKTELEQLKSTLTKEGSTIPNNQLDILQKEISTKQSEIAALQAQSAANKEHAADITAQLATLQAQSAANKAQAASEYTLKEQQTKKTHLSEKTQLEEKLRLVEEEKKQLTQKKHKEFDLLELKILYIGLHKIIKEESNKNIKHYINHMIKKYNDYITKYPEPTKLEVKVPIEETDEMFDLATSNLVNTLLVDMKKIIK